MIATLVRDSAFYRFADGARAAHSPGIGRRGGLPSADRRNELVSEVVSRYRANLSIVDQLGRGFGFKALYYWQPLVFDKATLTPYEREEAEKFALGARIPRRGLREYPRIVGAPIRATVSRPQPSCSPIPTSLIFIDYCHTTEAANDRIAEVIARDVLESLQPADRAHRGGDPGTGNVR